MCDTTVAPSMEQCIVLLYFDHVTKQGELWGFSVSTNKFR